MSESSGSAAQRPVISYPQALPVVARREDIAAAIAAHPVVIVAGETGSGKTTQIPKICLELGRGSAGIIGHTQPRRLAARTVAARIAAELGVPVGGLVGYQVRFSDQTADDTAIKLMTDGILLNDMQHDPLLRRYDTLIIDEAHERSLNIDFLLGYLKRLLPRRPDLKVIVTSATIDVERFSQHFDAAPVIEVSGRSYPVETHFLGSEVDAEEDQAERIAQLVDAIEAGDFGARGDVLVFLPGEREIRELAQRLRHNDRVDVLPLYARLSQAEQNRVFEGGRRRAGLRVVLATNVAETSLTVPGIRYVIDPGMARLSRYSHRSRLQRLPVEPVSQASADQRRGRCGREAPGVCLRLYSEDDYNARPEFTEPEIQRTNLASVVLQMLSLGLGDVADFPFIDPPDSRLIRDGYKLLEELGAVDARGRITRMGGRMARFPVDPRLARMVLEAVAQGCVEEVLVIASALSVQDPRERPAEKRAQADQAHARFQHPRSDFLAWLSLWRYYEEQRQALSQNRLRKLCQAEFLSYSRLREWRDVHRQLSIACRAQKIAVRPALAEEEKYRAVHVALLSGLLSNLAQWQEGREYLGSRNRRLQVFPGSSQARKRHRWLVAAEIVETSRVYAREVAAVDPRWALGINPGLLKHHYYEPRWRARTGQAVAYERVTLYGLTLVDKQVVHYGPIAPAESRALLIREGLVAGQFRQPPPFLRHNLRLVRDIEALESRTRRRDILVPEQVQFEFYDARLPADIVTTRSLLAWLKREPAAAQSLHMTRDMLAAVDPGADVAAQFPDHLVFQDLRLALSYTFEPGGDTDGVSVTVPVGLLNRVPRQLFDWLVPGLLREKCIALVRSLPKEKRKHLVPAPDVVDRALAELTPGDTDLLQALATVLSRLGGVAVARNDWSVQKLDDYYRMNVRVVDAEGRLLAQGRDLDALIRRFREDTRQSIGAAEQTSPARDGLLEWDFDALPREWRFRQAGVDIVSFPALVDAADSVAIALFDYAGQARIAHRLGVTRLLRLATARLQRELRKQLLRGNAHSLLLARAGFERDALLEDLIDAALVQAMQLDTSLPYTRADYAQCLQNGKGAVVARANELEATLVATLDVLGEVRSQLLAPGLREMADTRDDIERQLGRLFAAHFQRDTPLEWLSQYPRYMKALRTRLERLRGQYEKDRKNMAMLAALQAPLDQALQARPALLSLCAPARDFRWMLEEFRVSLFAQNLGTRRAVSAKRLQEQWQAVSTWLRDNPHD
ncbi:MAG: ATP-dependent RNA helicase HrpA [Halioglobus sp.]